MFWNNKKEVDNTEYKQALIELKQAMTELKEAVENNNETMIRAFEQLRNEFKLHDIMLQQHEKRITNLENK